MLYQLPSVRSNKDGFDVLAKLAADTRELLFDKLEVSFKGNNFFEAQQADFGSTGKKAREFAEEILTCYSLCSRRDSPFSRVNVSSILNNFENAVCDFNDGVLIESCSLNGWKLVTNDRDCTEGGIEIIISNKKLMKACP